VELLQQEYLYRESGIEARVRADTVRIRTHNVKSLAVTLSRDLIPSGRAAVEIGDELWYLGFDEAKTFYFSHRAGLFRRGENLRAGPGKDSGRFGPIKQAMFSPFVLVYGTRADSATTELLTGLATLKAFQWWRRGNGFVDVLADSEVTAEVVEKYNLILFGGAAENSVSARMERRLPIRRVGGNFLIGESELPGPGLAAKFVYPNPLNPLRLVVINQGTDIEGIRLLSEMRPVYAGAGLPDFIVYDDDVRRKGWGGIITAGFFDSAWRIDPGLMYCRGD
jgi:hypothetical protein